MNPARSQRGPRQYALQRIRGALLTGCSAVLTVAAHSLADGGIPHLSITVPVTIVLGWISVAIAEYTRRFSGILLTLGSTQLIMHCVLDQFSGHSSGGWDMVINHVLTTLLIAVLFTHAERMLDAVITAFQFLLPILWWIAPPPTISSAQLPTTPAAGVLVLDVLLHRVHRRRGPPLHS